MKEYGSVELFVSYHTNARILIFGSHSDDDETAVVRCFIYNIMITLPDMYFFVNMFSRFRNGFHEANKISGKCRLEFVFEKCKKFESNTIGIFQNQSNTDSIYL